MTAGADCDDTGPTAASTYPGAPDAVCNGEDNDCDGSTDEDYVTTPTTCGVGECAGNTGQVECQAGSEVDTCDPFEGEVDEFCDGLDNDCDGLTDDNDPGVIGRSFWYADNDTDTYGDPNSFQLTCSPPAGYVTNNLDCNDNDIMINPAAVDATCDGVDNDFDGFEICVNDLDYDGHDSN